MASIDVKTALTNCLLNEGKSIQIPADLFGGAGPFFDAINQFVANGKLQLQGPGGSQIVINGDENSATLTASGVTAPFGNTTVTFTATKQDSSVEISITATIQPGWSIATAWPGELSGYPFSSLTITEGALTLTANVGEKNLALLVTVNASTFGGQSLSSGQGTGLLKVTYTNGQFGCGAGFVLTGTWNPLSALGIDKITTISITEIGLFLSTIDLGSDDLAAFQYLVGDGKVAFLPSDVKPGLTVLAGLELENDVAILDELFTGKPTLDLTAFVASAGDTVSISAELKDVSLGAVTFNDVKLEWDSDPESKKIVLSLTSLMNQPDINMKNTGLCGTGTLVYSAPQSATFAIEIGKCGGTAQGWVNPFFIQNLTIDDFGLEVVLQETVPEVAINVGGEITIGSGAHAVDIMAASGLTFDGDIPAPSGVIFTLQPADHDKAVSLADIIDDVASVFGAHFDLSSTLLNDVSVKQLKLAVVQVPFTFNGVEYKPFISIAGDIFIADGSDAYEFDMMLTVNTQADPPYMQACGTFNKNGGAITVDVGSVNLLTMSNTAGDKGPAACVDTLALTSDSSFCGTTCTAVSPGGSGYFLVADANISVLSLTSSVRAKVAKDSFDFLMGFNWLGGVLSTQLGCTFAPSEAEFAASIEFGANLPDLTLDWGFIGSFTIPAPKINVEAAVGTFVPGQPVFGDWTPSSAPYFYFNGGLSWGSLDWSFTISIDASTFQSIATAFSDFGNFIVTWIKNNVAAFLKAIVQSLENLLRMLYQLGWAMWDAVKAVYNFFASISWDDIFNAAKAIWASTCAMTSAENTYNGLPPSVQPMLMPALGVLADSGAGQNLLFHYYLHQEEISELLRPDRESGRQARRRLHEHLVREQSHPTNRPVPAVIDVLEEIAPFASVGLRASLGEVFLELGAYRHLDQPSLLAALSH